MEFFIEKQLLNIVYSVILGLIFGGLYDIIRIIYVLCGIASYRGQTAQMKSGKLPFVLFALFDFSYALCVTVLYSIFDYWTENGRFRFFILISVAVGFFIYYNTIGRAVMLVSETVAAWLKKIFTYLVIKPLTFIGQKLFRLVKFMYSKTFGALIGALIRARLERRTKKCLKSLKYDISFENNNKNSHRRGI